MTIRTIVVIILALVCGASLAVGLLQTGNRSASGASVNTESIVVATGPIPMFHEIAEGDVEIRSCSKEWVTKNTPTTVEEVVGKRASVNLFEGDVVSTDKLSEKELGSGLMLKVSPGMRAYTIQTSRVASNVAGFILPTSRVDVLLNMRGSRGDSTGGGSTTTLLQNIEVLAVAEHIEVPDDFKVDPQKMTSVTLHVTPQQANDLDLGQNMGVLTLSLRNPEDKTSVETIPSLVSDVRFLGDLGLPEGMVDEPVAPEPAVAAPKRPAPMWVVTLRGRHRGRVMLDDGRRY